MTIQKSILFCLIFVGFVFSVFNLEAEEINTQPVEDFEAIAANSKGDLSKMIENFSEADVKELVTKVLTKRLKFIDLSYVRPESNDGKEGWNAKYDFRYSNSKGKGLSLKDDRLMLEEVSLDFELSGSYSFESATNVEDYSKVSLDFSYLYGDFGKPQIIDKSDSRKYQKCLSNARDLYGDFDKLTAAEAKCADDFNIKELEIDQDNAYVFHVSANVAIEGDQQFDNKQDAYGLSGVFSRSQWPSVKIDYQRIDASNNENRTVLTDKNNYDRASIELGHRIEIMKLDDGSAMLYFSYRYFKEISAPVAIKQTGLDSFDYFSASIRFPASILGFVESDDFNLYLRYVDGQLPFDLQSDKSIQLGFSTNISGLAKLLKK